MVTRSIRSLATVAGLGVTLAAVSAAEAPAGAAWSSSLAKLAAAHPATALRTTSDADNPHIWLVSGAGEAGEGEEGPLFDAARVKEDPVVYLTAIEAAAAHYHAGRAAYAAGRPEEGAEMFAHGVSEVYVDLKPALLAQGVTDFQPLMDKAVELASSKAPAADVDAAAAQVLQALAAASEKQPPSELSAADVRRQVLTEMLNRASRNYMIASRGVSRDAYLDGYGYRLVVEQRAPAVIADVKASAPDTAERLQEAVAALSKGYAKIESPSTGELSASDLLVAVSKAMLAVGAS